MIKNIKKGFNFVKTKLNKSEKVGTIKEKIVEAKDKVVENKDKIIRRTIALTEAVLLTGTMFLAGCSLNNETSKASHTTKSTEAVSLSDYHDSYWDSNSNMFDAPDEESNKQNEESKSQNNNTSTTLDVYYFENDNTKRIEKEPIGKTQVDAHKTFEKFESYNLAYRGIEEMDDNFENKYTYTPEDSYRLVTENFDVVKTINKANSSNTSEKEDAELMLSMAKDYYKNWLEYNADTVLDYEENKMKAAYKNGDTVNIYYFDNSGKRTMDDKPVGTNTKDAYEEFEKFESYNLAYRAIESMDDSYQNLYSFTPEEKYALIAEGFNIDEAIKKSSSQNQQEREQARRQLIAAKEYYKNWLEYNDDEVIDYMEAKIK